ncbi:hemin ABC transporter ATP-binding protein [Secundilactobacillus paracollinoides]|uniref:Putative hemin import ATP-binding protein HrtA n=1 Tax=Secundilactobacillus paracollinoides TaxID=240427 RepID=A0A1B2IUV7_9LACO|nr:ABC transporter ATP-binding protein [Secundilactobacillus paracollinoides]ANZ60042.1 hemin ABC transporter ATP-binding protein [Secundilactobacillus paracollinoides]ANZ63004.1 hemin ABC transporter ATP-binding protein [Secundilactobacillus paracollinoides]ANZ65835.1 hemin ABC transporter ATP-binding protein [Secundilactobacillus paracollinoides]
MALMTLKKVVKQFGQGDTVVNAVTPTDLSVDAGEFLALTGPSGSGKTTLLTMMGGLQTPTSGQILLGDRDIAQLSEHDRSQLRFADFGFILQASNLVPYLTVQEQLSLVDRITKNKQPDRQQRLLTDLGIWDQRGHYPNELSGGQRQRVAIARAFYHQPKMIFADEPTASLDAARAVQVVQTMAQMAHDNQQAIVMITHDDRLLTYTDRVMVMTDGVLTAADKAMFH